MVWREVDGLQVEGTDRFVPNMVSFLFTLETKIWYVVEAYVPPNNVPFMYHMEQAQRAPQKLFQMILMGDLNTRLGDPHDKY